MLSEEFRMRLLATSVMTVGLQGYAGVALAQSAEPAAVARLEEVVVTARRTIDTPPEEIKRDAPGIVDSVTASEVEKLPDATLAEVLDRVVGVSSDKFTQTSEAGSVTVRGFDARYNSMDIDGNPIWFTSQNNRGAQLAILPASIVKETSVYKTVTPDQDANSIGGHISLRTLRAFDGGGAPYLSVGGRVGKYEQEGIVDDGPSYRFYGAGKTTFGEDHQFGAVFGFDAQRVRNYDKYGAVDGYVQVNGEDQANGNIYSNGTYDKDIERNAFYGKFEARVNDELYGFVSANIFDEHTNQYLQRASTYVYQSSGRTTNYSDGTADFNKGVGQTKEYDYDIRRKAKVLGSGLDYRLSERGVMQLRANYTDYDYDVTLRYPETFQITNLAGHYDLNGDLPDVDVSTPGFSDPANWVYRNKSASYIQDQMLADKVYALRADYDWNTFASARGIGFQTGIGWTRLDRHYDQQQDNYKLPSGSTLHLSDVVPTGSNVADNSAMQTDWSAFWSYMYQHGVMTVDDAATSDYDLTEDVTAVYGALYLSGERYRIVAGPRYEGTRFTDDTADVIDGATTPVERKHSYSNLLPNVQATYRFTSELMLRAAYTKTIARPDFSDFAMGQTTTLDTLGNPVVKGTNPYLDPRESTNYDLSLEYYFDGGYASAALFKKDIVNETFTQRTETVDDGGVVTRTEEIPLNTGSAQVYGLELSAAKRRLDWLPAPFDRLGVRANYTRLDGEWDVVFTDGSRRSVGGLRNQPKWLANLNLSYDFGALDVNLAWRLRGRTFTGTFGTTPAGDIWIDDYDKLDLQANYSLGGGVRLFAEVTNLTNSYWRQITGLNDSLHYAVNGGRGYYFGVKYKY